MMILNLWDKINLIIRIVWRYLYDVREFVIACER